MVCKPDFNFLKFWTKCFLKDMIFGQVSYKLPNGLLGTNVYETLESCW